MIEFIVAFFVFLLCVAGLGLSLFYGRGAIKGSCGATENLRGFDAGDACSGACGGREKREADCQQRQHCRHRHRNDRAETAVLRQPDD